VCRDALVDSHRVTLTDWLSRINLIKNFIERSEIKYIFNVVVVNLLVWSLLFFNERLVVDLLRDSLLLIPKLLLQNLCTIMVDILV